jgi:glutamyl-tRNA synthetase
VKGSAERILDDLRWLGITWDEGPDVGGPCVPYIQSARAPLYQAALEWLGARGLTYPCDCSRAEIARVASAPHAGEETRYSGTCRDKNPARKMKREPATRLRVTSALVRFHDGVAGPQEQDVAEVVGDFVLRRGDGVFAYQLAVTVDDLAMGITDVVRGDDLLASTPRQLLLARLLGAREPRYWHLPLVVATDGTRLAKRTPGAAVRALREAGVTREEVVRALREGLGLETTPIAWPTRPWPIPASWTARPGRMGP